MSAKRLKKHQRRMMYYAELNRRTLASIAAMQALRAARIELAPPPLSAITFSWERAA